MINADRDIASPPAYSLPMVLLLLLSACTAKDTLAAGSSGYIANAEQRVAAVDWSKAETVNVALSEYEFSPSSLNFQEGHSYKLHLANPGGEVHDFASKPFFQAIAAARLVASDKTIPLPHLERIAVRPGEAKDLYFVAIRPGFYPFKCTEPLHAAFGMTGTARIE